jgi:hypothetical protein
VWVVASGPLTIGCKESDEDCCPHVEIDVEWGEDRIYEVVLKLRWVDVMRAALYPGRGVGGGIDSHGRGHQEPRSRSSIDLVSLTRSIEERLVLDESEGGSVPFASRVSIFGLGTLVQVLDREQRRDNVSKRILKGTGCSFTLKFNCM